jgi:hypothetical protein
MTTSNLATFLASLTLAITDMIRLRLTAGTPEAWLWGVLTLAGIGVMLASVAESLPREEGVE